MIVVVKTYLDGEDAFDGPIELPDGSDVRAALKSIGLLEGSESRGNPFLYLINQQAIKLTEILKEGDRLLIIESMMGG